MALQSVVYDYVDLQGNPRPSNPKYIIVSLQRHRKKVAASQYAHCTTQLVKKPVMKKLVTACLYRITKKTERAWNRVQSDQKVNLLLCFLLEENAFSYFFVIHFLPRVANSSSHFGVIHKRRRNVLGGRGFSNSNAARYRKVEFR